jgi:alpha-aminoadipate carrier protein LysW
MGECFGKSDVVQCKDCGETIIIPLDAVQGEIVSCPACGAEWQLLFKNGEIELGDIELEGEDWGE